MQPEYFKMEIKPRKFSLLNTGFQGFLYLKSPAFYLLLYHKPDHKHEKLKRNNWLKVNDG